MTWRRLALGFVTAWFLIGGVFHFTATPAFVSIVPPYAPWPEFWVLFSGVCEIAGAIGVLVPKTRRMAGWALIVLSVCVTPANLEMALHAERYREIGATALWLRMAFQPVLIWIIWWSTRATYANTTPVNTAA
jgi:uncharacterized membrane protein